MNKQKDAGHRIMKHEENYEEVTTLQDRFFKEEMQFLKVKRAQRCFSQNLEGQVPPVHAGCYVPDEGIFHTVTESVVKIFFFEYHT